MVVLPEKIPMPFFMVILETLTARRTVQFIHMIGLHRSIFEAMLFAIEICYILLSIVLYKHFCLMLSLYKDFISLIHLGKAMH